ncbi:uncharacterized protein LOC135124131 isoform X1 [Zophobas morio]|uniref:uncharacterized protein LOC135124131 isoform X1 n=1 Tax=Zophobas morio TaxID=2755281 RepID=UPI003082BB4E
MNSTRKKRGGSRGTVNTSRAPTSNKTTKKPSERGVKKISKYFSVPKKADSDNSDELSDSPYRNCLSEVKSVKLNDSASDLDDFKTPQAINKISKIAPKPVEKPARKKKSRQLPLRKFVENNLRHSDVNPDHLQMALALSESTYQAENPSSQDKKDSFKLAFEKFGFGYSKSRVSVANRKDPSDKKINKKSRYRFITPILKIRTTEEREELISSKVSLILAQNNRKPVENNPRKCEELFCESLRKFSCQKIFKINCLDVGELQNGDVFYVRGLGVERSHAPCGCLLRDWTAIPGRERSPEPNVTPPVYTESPKVSPPRLENLPSTSSKRRSSIVTLELSCSEIDNSPFEENNDVSIVDLGDSIEAYEPTNVDCGKYRLSPEVTSPILGKISPRIETPRSLHTSPNLECGGDFTPKFADNLLSPSELWAHPPSPPITSPLVNTSSNSQRTPPQRNKRSRDCLSPDLFDSDVEPSPNRLRGGQDLEVEEIECYDLTQSDNEEEKSFHLNLSNSEDSIGRRSDLNVTEYVHNLLSQCKDEPPPIKKLEKISASEDDSQQSQSSVCISDDELNYSSVFSTPLATKKVEYELSEDEEFGASLEKRITKKCKEETPSRLPLTNLCTDNFPHISNKTSRIATTPTLDDSFNEVLSHVPSNDTPSTSNASFVIKTKNVTPMANYDDMDTPKITKELDRYGLKPLKRQKGAKLLKYIYESTHPIIGDENHAAKKRRTHYPQYGNLVGDVGDPGEVILERKQSKKFATCALPLHIAWHNFVMSNPKIRENILLYEPLQLEVLHSMLKDQGFKFNIQDLLAFLDKKCITIRTAQGQHHGKNPR